jgi:chorismate synthase
MNSFGRQFRVSILGESHGSGVGVVIDGIPAGISLSAQDFELDLSRRRSGAIGTTPRSEPDSPILFSGIFNNKTTGAPVTILFHNKDTDSSSYEKMKDTPRPGHADFVAHKKFGGYQDYRGGGHFSGRLTAALVAAGVVAKKIIKPIDIKATLIEAGGSTEVESTIKRALEKGDSIGGIVECKAIGLPIGLGEPFFDSIESVISHLAFSIPAVKGIEFGSGFLAAKMLGSEHNDEILNLDGKTKSNHAGGINGGITNGNELTFRIAIKPTSSIKIKKETVNLSTGESTELSVSGRHDACIALRVPPVLEAVTAIALADFMLLEQKTPKISGV